MSGNKKEGEPDMVPMLDMVFQLITFFMLVINFKSAAMDLDLKLPVIGSARPVDLQGSKDMLVLNVNKEGQLKIFGEVKPNVEEYIANEAAASRLAVRAKNPNFGDSDELPSIVVVRADRATPFKLLNRVIKAAQDNGFRHFSMKATNKES